MGEILIRYAHQSLRSCQAARQGRFAQDDSLRVDVMVSKRSAPNHPLPPVIPDLIRDLPLSLQTRTAGGVSFRTVPDERAPGREPYVCDSNPSWARWSL